MPRPAICRGSRWRAGTPTHVDCTSPTLPAGACDVELSLTPKLTSEGQAAGATPAAFTVDATVTLADDGWVVGSPTPVSAAAPITWRWSPCWVRRRTGGFPRPGQP